MLCASKPTRNNHLVVKQVRWEKPDPGWFKVNTDKSLSGSIGTTAGGGLIRDEFGNWVIGFSRKIGRTDSFVVELWALRYGLQLCCQLNACAILIELDAKSLVDALNNSSYCNPVISPPLDDCKLLIDQTPQVCIKHTYQEANKCADRLANLGLFQYVDFLVHYDPPVELIRLIEADSLGSCRNRLCPSPFSFG